MVRLATRNWIEHEVRKVLYVTYVIQHLEKLDPLPRAENQDLWARYLPHTETALKFQDDCSDGVAKEKLRSNLAESRYVTNLLIALEFVDNGSAFLANGLEGLTGMLFETFRVKFDLLYDLLQVIDGLERCKGEGLMHH